jgi:hypothetical protein
LPYWGLNSGLCTWRQAIYCLSHSSSPGFNFFIGNQLEISSLSLSLFLIFKSFKIFFWSSQKEKSMTLFSLGSFLIYGGWYTDFLLKVVTKNK